MAKRKKNKKTNNDLQNIAQKTKDRATITQLKTEVNTGAAERLVGFCSTRGTRLVTLVTNPVRSPFLE